MRHASVSVIIPCYNSAATIKRAVDSVLTQTMLPKELILIDDFSNDNKTINILNEIKLKYEKIIAVKVVLLGKNSGPATARNIGWDIASENYIAFLDADDSWNSRKIELQYTWMKEHENVVFTGHQICRKQNYEKREYPRKLKEAKLINRKNILYKHFFSNPSVVMIKKNIDIRFKNGWRYAEDYQLWLEIVFKYNAYFFKEELAYYHKRFYGESGLSKDIYKIEKGELKCFNFLYKEGKIKMGEWIFAIAFSILKYIRRFIIVKINMD